MEMILISLILVLAPSGDLPELAAGVKIEADGRAIDVSVGHLVPCVADWNGDGLNDLIVGQFSQGKVKLFVNTGSAEEPVLEDAGFMQAGGAEITLPAG
jgi:hypothetical protein